MNSSVAYTAIPNIPLVQRGDNLVQLIQEGCLRANIQLQSGDIFVLAQKIVSKAEGQDVLLNTVNVSSQAEELGEFLNTDPRLVELVLRESTDIIRSTPGNKETGESGRLIVRHRLNHILANAGIDMSNVEQGSVDGCALLLPINPDESCENIRQALFQQTQAHVGVIINDSLGRPWRNGTVGVALGVAGLPALLDLRGQPDLFGRALKTSKLGFADEIASAASLLMGQGNESRPVIHIRGIRFNSRQASVQELIRPQKLDLFL